MRLYPSFMISEELGVALVELEDVAFIQLIQGSES